MSAPLGRLPSLSYIWEVILGRSCGDSIATMQKIFQFSRIELVLSMNLHPFSSLCLPVCLWGLARAGDGHKEMAQAAAGCATSQLRIERVSGDSG